MSRYQAQVYAFSAETQVVATRMYAMEGQTFVCCSTQVVSKGAQDIFCQTDEHRALVGYGGGFARILGPGGEDLVEPLAHDEEGILYADINLAAIVIAKGAADPVGHYSRPDVFQLHFNKQSNRAVKTDSPTLTIEVEEVGELSPPGPASIEGALTANATAGGATDDSA